VERRGDPEELNGHGRGREEEEEEEEEKKGERRWKRMWKGGVIADECVRWCNPHLLRGRIVIARRERDWRVILKYFLCPQYGEYTHNMSYILDFLDVICILFGSKNVNMSVHIIYLHVIYIYRAMYRNEGEK